MSSIVIQGDTSGSITVEAPSVAGTHTLTLPKATGNIATDATVGLGMKNRIINGNMVIDQRNSGASVTPASSLTYTLDRWRADMSVGSKFSVQQVADAPSNFVSSLKVTSTSAYTVGAADYFSISHQLEGYNVADLGFGTSGAKNITLSFWVKSSLTGTHGGVFGNQGDSQLYPFSYTISSVNTWEQKTINISARTVGTWATNNTASMRLQWYIGLGSNYYGTVNQWNTSSVYGVSGQTNVVATNGATWQVTGVQLEVGENATPFENRLYGTELALCQRYCINYGYPFSTPVAGRRLGCGSPFSSTSAYVSIGAPCKMRATPSVSGQMNLNSNGFSASISSFGSIHSDSGVITLETVSSAIPTTQPVMLRFNTTTDYLLFEAEL